MARIFVVLVFLAAPAAAPPVNPNVAGVDPQTGQRSYNQHALNKIRPGSMLRSEAPPPDEPEDLRGELERRRDAELTKHYGRMAELDVIAELADKVHDLALAERTEDIRRKEVQRFREAMQDLRVSVRHTTMEIN